MKKNFIIASLLLIALMGLATACSSSTTTEADEALSVVSEETAVEAVETNVAPNRPFMDANQSSNLIFGSFELEGTDYEITAAQAAELLPLWKVYLSLLQSSTAAAVEQEALINQIADTMTSEQITYITDMEFEPGQMAQIMTDLGIESQFLGGMGQNGGEGGFGDLTEAQRTEMQALREANGGGEGGPGGGFGAGQDVDPEQLATMQAERAANGGGARGNTQDELLLPALIELLQSKINE